MSCRAAGCGAATDPRLLRDFIHRALEHETLLDHVYEILHSHLAEDDPNPSLVPVLLRRALGETIAAATALDWRVIADELIADARAALSDEPTETGIEIDRAQRDAIYAHVFSDLTIAVGETYVALEHGEWAAVRALRCRIEQNMRLLDDIGWGREDAGECFALTLPRGTLAATIERLHASADGLTRELLLDVLDAAGVRVLDARDALAALLDQLARPGTES